MHFIHWLCLNTISTWPKKTAKPSSTFVITWNFCLTNIWIFGGLCAKTLKLGCILIHNCLKLKLEFWILRYNLYILSFLNIGTPSFCVSVTNLEISHYFLINSYDLGRGLINLFCSFNEQIFIFILMLLL